MQLMTIDKFTVFNKYKSIIFEQKNIKNIVHQEGEQYMLNVLFNLEQSINDGKVASSYYAGLDNRITLSSTDSMLLSIVGEPLPQTSYSRQQITTWTEPFISNGVYVVKSNPITFDAAVTGWGPVSNIFLTTNSSGGILISSAKLSETVTLNVGDSIVLTISLSLNN